MKKPLKSFCLSVILTAFVNLVGFIGALNTNPSVFIKVDSQADSRVYGVDRFGWSQAEFGFRDNLVLPWSAKVGFAFDTTRPPEAGAALVEILVNQISLGERLIKREPFYLENAKSAKNIDFKYIVKNPFYSAENPKELKGVRLTRIKLEPKYRFLLPNLKEIFLTYFFSITLTLSVLFWVTGGNLNKKLLIISTSVICSGLIFYFFSNCRFYGWSRGWWILAPLTLFFMGSYFGAKFRRNQLPHSIYQSKHKNTLLLIPILLFAIWIRFSSIDFGLPQIYHPDEARKANIVKDMIVTGDLNPNYFKHPSFLLYATALAYKTYSLISILPLDVENILFSGRSVSAIFGVLSVWILYLIGKTLYGYPVGLLSALLLAINPLHIVCSRYVKEDVSMIFFLLVSLLFVLRFIFTKAKFYYLPLAGLFAGFATGVKYTGILSAVFLLTPIFCLMVCNLYNQLPSWLKFKDSKVIQNNLPPNLMVLILTAISIVLIPVGFLLFCPYSIINTSKFVEDFLFEGRHMKKGHGGLITATQYLWSFHLEYSFIKTLTVPLFIFAIFSLGFFFSIGTISGLVPIAGFLLFYLPAEWVNAKPFPQAERYILPTIPFLILAITHLAQRAFSGPVLVKVLVFFIFTYSFFSLTNFNIAHKQAMKEDTRDIATKWVQKNIPAGSKIISDWLFYAPVLDRSTYQVLDLKSSESASIIRPVNTNNLVTTDYDYFITSSFYYQRYIFQLPSGNFIGQGYLDIFNKLTPQIEFTKNHLEYGFHNPTIRIYKLK